MFNFLFLFTSVLLAGVADEPCALAIIHRPRKLDHRTQYRAVTRPAQTRHPWNEPAAHTPPKKKLAVSSVGCVLIQRMGAERVTSIIYIYI